jgi:tellurite methyltransferase
MKRHPSLASLSRDHHHALALARDVRKAEASDPREVQLRFERELAPHFGIEERELVPRCEAHGEPLSSQAAQVIEDHEALRQMVRGLGADGADGADGAGASLKDRLVAFGDRLEAHVRFEERTWFPSLEEHLGVETLARLAASLRPAPASAIVAFHADDAGDFVADLACGHAQHVRHRPPFERREWVTTEAGRSAQIGTMLPCLYCRMPRLPSEAVEYKRTSEFDEGTVPAGLTKSHTLKAGTWGEIVVTAGRVLYVLEDDGDCGIVLHSALRGTVGPERPHHVELQPGARFFVRFLRAIDETGERKAPRSVRVR